MNTLDTHNQPRSQYPLKATLRKASWLIMLLMTCFIIWATFARLDEVITAQGSVAPKEQIKVIQHLEGGILEAIMVNEGDVVHKGQILLKLSLGIGRVNRMEKQAELDSLYLSRARLQAQINHQQPLFPDDIAQRHMNMVNAEQKLFSSSRQKLAKSIAVADEKSNQKQLEIRELQARLNALYKDKKIQQEQVTITASLYKKGLTSRLEHLEKKALLEKISGQISILKKSIPRAKSAYSLALAEKDEVIEKFYNASSKDLNKTEQLISRISELLAKANDQVLRTEIQSPIEGIVKKMRYTTIHGVIKAGDAIMEIVPNSDNLIIEARLNPVDRGYVEEGQQATIKVSTYDYSRYGGIKGKVIHIGADTLTDQNTGQSYFEVNINTEKNYLGANKNDLAITPGMEASIDIHTGTKTVLQYLIQPVLKIKNEAFRER